MKRGRALTDQDLANGPKVAVVNETFAKKYFSGADPLTQQVLVEQLTPGVQKLGPPIPWQVVGVYGDVRNHGLRGEVGPDILVPLVQCPWPQLAVAVRTKVEPATLIKTIAATVESMDPNLPLAHAQTMDDFLAEFSAGDRFEALLFGGFAVIALVLAALGIYGVMSFAVAQRTHEIGLRMALGAGRDRVLTLVVREGMILAVVGLALGFGGAVLVGRLMRGMWYRVGVIDPTAFSIVSVLLMASAWLACYVPARRATQVDPMQALRDE
jgi:putative ABC transport system permease protein